MQECQSDPVHAVMITWAELGRVRVHVTGTGARMLYDKMGQLRLRVPYVLLQSRCRMRLHFRLLTRVCEMSLNLESRDRWEPAAMLNRTLLYAGSTQAFQIWETVPMHHMQCAVSAHAMFVENGS